MPERAEVEALVRAVYAARLADDVDGMMALLAPGACLRIAGAVEASPVACSVEAQGLRTTLEGLVGAFGMSDYQLLDLVVDGAKAVAHSRLRVHAKASGKKANTEIVDLITTEGGRITSFVQFCDTALAASLVTPGAAPAARPIADT